MPPPNFSNPMGKKGSTSSQMGEQLFLSTPGKTSPWLRGQTGEVGTVWWPQVLRKLGSLSSVQPKRSPSISRTQQTQGSSIGQLCIILPNSAERENIRHPGNKAAEFSLTYQEWPGKFYIFKNQEWPGKVFKYTIKSPSYNLASKIKVKFFKQLAPANFIFKVYGCLLQCRE